MAQAAQANITPFIFDHHNVRVVTEEDGPWFVGKDVCVALGLSNHKQALARLNDDERKGVIVVDPLGKNAQRATGVNEPGIYRLVFTSRVDAAERFKRWLAHEVLPAIRKTGTYTSDKPIDVRNHTRRTSTKVDDALRLKKNIDRLESVVATIQPTQPNFCAMVIDGEPVFVDVNKYDGAGRAVVIGHDGRLRIEYVEPNTMEFQPFGARTALGERRPGQHGSTIRNSLIVVGKVMEPHSHAAHHDRQRVVDHVTDRLRGQIMTLLESVPWSDRQIATELRCNPKLVREVRRIQSRKPSDKTPMRQIEHEPRTVAPYRDRVIAMIQQGYGNAEIARTLGCHVHTVERRRNLMRDQARKLLS